MDVPHEVTRIQLLGSFPPGVVIVHQASEQMPFCKLCSCIKYRVQAVFRFHLHPQVASSVLELPRQLGQSLGDGVLLCAIDSPPLYDGVEHW